MTILETHNRLDFLLNKEISGYIPPDQKDLALDLAQIQEFNDLVRVASATLQINSDLNPFRKTIDFTTTTFNLSTARYGTGSTGILVLPDNFLYLQALITSSGNEIEPLVESELAHRLSSTLIAPSTTYPVSSIEQEGGTVEGQDIDTRKFVQLYPKTGQAGTLIYLRRPAKPVFSYTTSGDTITHDAGASTNMEWNDSAMQRIIERAVIILNQHLQTMVNA